MLTGRVFLASALDRSITKLGDILISALHYETLCLLAASEGTPGYDIFNIKLNFCAVIGSLWLTFDGQLKGWAALICACGRGLFSCPGVEGQGILGDDLLVEAAFEVRLQFNLNFFI